MFAAMLSAETATQVPSRRSRRGRVVPQRRCVVSRASLPADRLIRFVVGPDRTIVPDIEGRLPGRGLWVEATREVVEAACHGRHFAKAGAGPVHVEAGLAERVEALLAQRCLNLIGLARRSSEAVAGFEKVSGLLRSGRRAVLLIAADAAADGRRKILSMGGNSAVIDLFSSVELGRVFGREKTVFAAVSEGGLAASLKRDAGRLKGFRSAGAVGEL